MFPPAAFHSPAICRQEPGGAEFCYRPRRPAGLRPFSLLVGLVTAGDYGIGVDELPQRRIALANLNYLLGQGDSLAALPDVHPLYGVAFELPLLLAERGLGLEDYHQIHRLRLTLTHLFFIVGAFFCYRLAYRLFNNRLLALFGLLIFLLHPRIYGHSFVGYKDAPFLSMFVIALYLLERAFRRGYARGLCAAGNSRRTADQLADYGDNAFGCGIGDAGFGFVLCREWHGTETDPAERRGVYSGGRADAVRRHALRLGQSG